MWSQTNCSASQTACLVANAASWHAGVWPIANFWPHWSHTTVVITTVFGLLSWFWRRRLAVPFDLGCRSPNPAITTEALGAAAHDRDNRRARHRRHVHRAGRHAPPWASPR